ncbi:MAG: hypothetical protein H0X30_18640 [Anaerolineae bacterium]|nr:hypothetical protein [Anaerolineae bacterium]
MAAGRSAAAASAADGSANSAAALLGLLLQRMNGSDPPNVQNSYKWEVLSYKT